MFRPVFIYKILIFSLIINIVFVLYLLLQSAHHSFLSGGIKDHYEINDYYSLYENDPISTNIKIIPVPMFVNVEHSKLSLSNGFRIVSNQKPTKDLQLAIARYSKYISLLTGFSIDINRNSSPSQNALIIDCPSILSKKNKYPKLSEDESYIFNITKAGAHLHASSLTGIIRGLSTFVQLIERDTLTEKISVPFAHIIDRPRFPWRGLMLDVSRHWMPVSVIEKTLNAMELSKLNVLHLHLSDDQGFRVESLQHPLLHDRKDFFTQKDIRYLIEYARQRRIRIIPEFDIPGHTTR
jgi:hexosaminidase